MFLLYQIFKKKKNFFSLLINPGIVKADPFPRNEMLSVVLLTLDEYFNPSPQPQPYFIKLFHYRVDNRD